MTINYQIITDEKLLTEYINWLPDLGPNEKFYGCLFARKKYCVSIPWPGSDKSQLKRFTATKENLLYKIRQMECPEGSYEIKGTPIPQEALALYLHINPRDLWKATIRSIGQLARVIECQGKNSNPHQEVLSEIQKAVGKKHYVIFDLDSKDPVDCAECIKMVNGICHLIETRGGYHILVPIPRISEIIDKMWYKNLATRCDVTGDNMSPVPGCIQGGYTPLLWKGKPPSDQERTMDQGNEGAGSSSQDG